MWVPGVALGGPVPPLRVDRGDDGVALDELARFDGDAVHEQRLGDLLHVGDGGPCGLARTGAADGADVRDLAAGLGVERRAVEHQLDAVGVWPRPRRAATTGTRRPSTKMPRILASEDSSSNPVNSVGPASTRSR